MTNLKSHYGFISKIIIIISYLYAIVLTSLVWIANLDNKKGFAIISMGIGLFFLWGICCGFLFLLLRNPVKNYFKSKGLSTFFLVSFGGILFALIEEFFATFMTNLAPLFGFSPYEVFITASPNYIEVVTKHSVIVFIPWFIAWGFILRKYTIHPNDVMVLFGITGVLAESLSFGLQNLLQFGFWIIIYGLMIYLPAFLVYNPENSNFFKRKYYPLLIIVPFLALVLWAILFIFILSVLKI